ncbi:unnamed protein product [Rhizoctonia solani]|nr:unnamed protein product [Rhizoctonia solani]
MLADDPLENPIPRTREFQVVVLAGHGANLQPLTNNVGGNTASKALLPVGNRPMISYVLHWVEDCGISDVLVVCPSVLKQEISHHLHRAEYSNMRLELKSVDEDDISISGTAELDLVVLPEDVDEPVAAALLYERQIPADGKDKGPKLVVGTDETTNTLLYIDGDNDDDEELEIHMGLTAEYHFPFNWPWLFVTWSIRFPNTRFTTRYLDSHVYILRRSVLGILREHPGLLSFREEVLPWLCKLGYRKSKRERWGTTLKHHDPAFKLAVLHATTHVHRDPLTGMITTSPSLPEIPQPYDDEVTRQVSQSTNSRPLRTAYVVHHAKDGFVGRGNTLAGYMELNRQALGQIASKHHSTRGGKPSPSTASDSIIPDSATIGERASIKRSVIGEHCRIGKNVKIQGCVVMDHVEIADGAKLDNCVVSRLCQIGERAVLKECEIETAFRVSADVNIKGEKLET